MTAHRFLKALETVQAGSLTGRIVTVSPSHLEASGPLSTVGDICELETPLKAEDHQAALAQVVAVDEGKVILVPLASNRAVHPGSKIVARPLQSLVGVGDSFAGRAIDALGAPIDQGAPILAEARLPLAGSVPAPLDRVEPDVLLETGVRALDGLLTLAIGQRVGVFAASGVGKTTLIRQLATQVKADRCVLCLVGERGREVEAIWRTLSGENDPARFTCVAATSDASAILRARAVDQALCLAEHWRDQGEHVVLILDSITRYAMAQREIGLAAGAPPTVRAYTPNVFASLPRVVERCGAVRGKGAITAIMTVLSETDDVDDPIVETMKSLLDGHIVLSRRLAEAGHFPAIDVPRSVSRMADGVRTQTHRSLARQVVAQIAAYEEARLMIESGIYKPGSNKELDRIIAARESLTGVLRQADNQASTLASTLEAFSNFADLGGPA